MMSLKKIVAVSLFSFCTIFPHAAFADSWVDFSKAGLSVYRFDKDTLSSPLLLSYDIAESDCTGVGGHIASYDELIALKNKVGAEDMLKNGGIMVRTQADYWLASSQVLNWGNGNPGASARDNYFFCVRPYGGSADTVANPGTAGATVGAGNGNVQPGATEQVSTVQVMVSSVSDFSGAVWVTFSDAEFRQINNSTSKLYYRLRIGDSKISSVFVHAGTGTAASAGTNAGTGNFVPPVSTGSNANTANAAGSVVSVSDGDIVRTADSPDVYIIKIINNKRFKRVILSPSVFISYGHLSWSKIKTISETQLSGYTTSTLVKVTGEGAIYELSPQGDAGTRKIFDTSRSFEPDSVYEINATDRDSYTLA